MKMRILSLLLAGLLLLSLTSCWEEDPADMSTSLIPGELEDETAQEEEAEVLLPLSFSLPYDAGKTLDPITCADGMQQVVGSLLYEGLFELDTQLELQPCLCERYTYDPETFTYVFTLRSGVQFSDGSALTAADVTKALWRAKSSQRYGARLAQMTSAAAGEGTVTVILAGANTGFPSLLDIPIVKSGTEGELVPVGTGAYYYAQDDAGPCLLANSSWWRGTEQPVERIGLSSAVDRESMLYQFTSHDVQLLTADLTGSDPISATGNVSFQDADTTIFQYLGLNTTREPFNNAAVRRAFSQGVNRAALTSAFLSGHALPAQFPVSPVSPLYPEELEQTYVYDDFAQALGEAVNSRTWTLTLLVNEENSFKVSAAEYLAQTLSASGVTIEVKALPWAEYTAALTAGNFDLYYGEVKLTADWDLRPLLAIGGSLNYGGWASETTNSLLAAYASATDRSTAMEALCRHLQQQAPLIPVCFKSTSVLVQAGVVEGLTPTMTNPFYELSSCVIHLREG